MYVKLKSSYESCLLFSLTYIISALTHLDCTSSLRNIAIITPPFVNI